MLAPDPSHHTNGCPTAIVEESMEILLASASAAVRIVSSSIERDGNTSLRKSFILFRLQLDMTLYCMPLGFISP